MTDAGPPADAARRFARAQELFHSALERAAAEREAWLRAECADDADLLARVRAMLAADTGQGALLDQGLPAVAGDLLGGEAALPAQAFGPYRLTGVLGEGGMGVVYRAHRADLGSDAAIKLLRDPTLSPARRERFAFEQRVLAQLSHPAIARLFDAGQLADGTPWFAMELVDGVPITDWCRAHAPSVEARLRLFRDVCAAVQHAHAHAILHRDLKPSNILVGADGGPKLLDFGIAKPLESRGDERQQTRTGLRLMTPAYAAPEQLRGGALGVHTDVYSLGVVLYELLADCLPFDHATRTPSEAAAAIEAQPPRRPSQFGAAGTTSARTTGRGAWSDLDVLCLTAMHADPARRYATVDQLVREIDRFLAGEPLEARGDSWRYRAGKFAGRHAVVLGLTAAALVLLVAVVGVYTWRLTRARDEARAAAAQARRMQQFTLRMLHGESADFVPSDTLRVVTLLDHGAAGLDELQDDRRQRSEMARTLGALYQALTRYDRAESLLTLALADAEAARPPAPREVTQALVARALLRADDSRFEAAEADARRAISLAAAKLPETAVERGDATSALGRVQLYAGDYEAALATDRRALAQYARSDPDGEGASITRSDMAAAATAAGRFAVADSLATWALEYDRRRHGPNHPNVAEDLFSLAEIRFKLARSEEAVELAKQAYGIALGYFGPHHAITARSASSYARMLIQADRGAEAAPLLREAIEIERATFGPRSPQVAVATHEMGNLAWEQEGPAKAVPYFRESAAIYRERYGDHNLNLAVTLSNLASVYMDAGDPKAAEQGFRDALAAYRGAVPDDHPDVAITRLKLGRSLLRQKRWAEGERETIAGYRLLRALAEPPRGFLTAARKDLVADYTALGRTADAARFRTELADTTLAQ